jgi:hypothetical protein
MTVETERHADRWSVSHVGAVVGTFETREAAESAARRLAEKRHSPLVLRDEGGRETHIHRFTTGFAAGD